jgi:hypothetical protein
MEYRKAEAPDRCPWTQVGISERRYYKLLPHFAQQINGRYDLDQDGVVARFWQVSETCTFVFVGAPLQGI